MPFRSIRTALGQSACALSVGTATAIFAACGGPAQTPISSVASRAAAPRHHHSKTFSYTGAQQNFMVPAGVTQVTVKAYGGSSGTGPGGGYVRATIPVTPGESLAVFVGGNSTGSSGGFNGGGNSGVRRGYGGGGASDVRQGGNALANRVIVAAGGGGGGAPGNSCQGGAGGAGGRGCGNLGGIPGGGGGGGYYGGGGGGGGALARYGEFVYSSASGGGGGGSSYTESSATNVTNQQGGSVAGLIVISW